ncbi:hypothetical protein AB0F52_41045 [Amycolatopsis sp. NPDC024027]|uniref:hypothetical protein n=1 Tax=Amycolatopsis sp. NPDC024027 TaxID=3154327 RepID=UPI003401B047
MTVKGSAPAGAEPFAAFRTWLAGHRGPVRVVDWDAFHPFDGDGPPGAGAHHRDPLEGPFGDLWNFGGLSPPVDEPRRAVVCPTRKWQPLAPCGEPSRR